MDEPRGNSRQQQELLRTASETQWADCEMFTIYFEDPPQGFGPEFFLRQPETLRWFFKILSSIFCSVTVFESSTLQTLWMCMSLNQDQTRSELGPHQHNQQ